MNVKILSIAAITSLVLAGCSSTESYTTDFLYENDDVRAQVLEDCKANEQSDENCKNAHNAKNKISGEAYAKARNR